MAKQGRRRRRVTMAPKGAYFEVKIQAAEKELESWRREHVQAMHVCQLEEVYSDVVKWVEDLFDMDNEVHRSSAAKKDDASIAAFDKLFEDRAPRLLELVELFIKAARETDAEAY